jgi:hypothetical protein
MACAFAVLVLPHVLYMSAAQLLSFSASPLSAQRFLQSLAMILFFMGAAANERGSVRKRKTNESLKRGGIDRFDNTICLLIRARFE